MNIVIKLLFIFSIYTSCQDTKESLKSKKYSQIHLGIEIYDGQRLIINGKKEPEAPDPILNNSTLLGIDSNNDGVRDDLERWINRVVKSWDDRKYKRMLLRLEAKNLRTRISSNDINKEKFKSIIIKNHNKLNSCLFEYIAITPKEKIDNSFTSYFIVLNELFYNTRLRKKERTRISKRIHGLTYAIVNFKDSHKYCDLEMELKND